MSSRVAFILVAVLALIAAVCAMYADADPVVSFVEQDSEASLMAELEAEADADADEEVDEEADEEADADAEADEEADAVSFVEVDAETEVEAEGQPPVAASYKPKDKNTMKYTGGAIKPALIFDNHVLSGKDRKHAKKQLGFFRVEPPAAVLPPILGDVDEKIINMAYDLSFEKRPSAMKDVRKKLNKGAKLLNAYGKMKSTLEWAMSKPAGKKAAKGSAKKGSAKKAAAKKAEKKF